MPLPKCRYCENSVKRIDAVVCFSPECDKRRRVENSKRSHDRRKEQGRKPEPRIDYCKAATKKVEMVCECGRRFRTFLTWDDKPQYHWCIECRQKWQDLEAGAMF